MSGVPDRLFSVRRVARERRRASLGVALFTAFAVARTAHAIFFLARKGRLRTASHTVSFLVLVILAGGVTWRALAGP